MDIETILDPPGRGVYTRWNSVITDAPDFSTWTHETLVVHSVLSYTVMQRQSETVMAMQRELKDCQERLARIQQLDDDWK